MIRGKAGQDGETDVAGVGHGEWHAVCRPDRGRAERSGQRRRAHRRGVGRTDPAGPLRGLPVCLAAAGGR